MISAPFNIIFPPSTPITPVVPLIIFNGESNSGGYADNNDLTTQQKIPRPAVQIFNNSTLTFEPLQIGVNNIISHAGLTNATHGWEHGLANAVEAGLFTGFSSVYLVKTGQGGSTIAQWATGSAYLNAYISRIQTAKQLILNSGKIPLPFIWYSQGINDRIAGTDATQWKTNTIAHFKNLRQYIGYAPIIEPAFMADQGSYNSYLTDIQATEKYFFVVSSDGAGLRDANHWNTQGMALLASRMVATVVNTIGLDINNYVLTSLLALSGSIPTIIVTPNFAAPTFTLQPSSQLAIEGSTATFSVSASGSPTPTYQWQKQESGTGAFTNISGATSSSYTTGVLTVANDNNDVYRCVATNSQGSATSNNAILGVSIPFTPVNWVGLLNATNASPSAGYISSSSANSGGRSDRAIDATQPFFFIIDLEDANASGTNVIYLSDNNTQDYGWSTSKALITGVYDNGGSAIFRANNILAPTQIALVPTYPCKIKGEKSGDNVVYSLSTNGGASWTVINTHAGVLFGQTTIYLKALFAVAGTKRIKVVQT